MSGRPRPTEETTWLDVADELFDEQLERDEAIELHLEDVEVDVPLSFGDGGDRARWEFDGTVRVHTEGHSGPLYGWLEYWRRREADDER